MNTVDSLNDLVDELQNKFVISRENSEELILKEDPGSNTGVEIKIAPRKIFFLMNSCADYHQFVKALETNLKIISQRIIPKEILCIGVQGCYLYPISSFREFSQLAFSWTGKYINNYSLMEINDLGVTVYFREGSLKVNLACQIMTQDQIDRHFFGINKDTVAKLNLFINFDIATDEAVKMDSAATHAIGQVIKDQVYNATQMIEERLGEKISFDL
jgi:hypothetical protein